MRIFKAAFERTFKIRKSENKEYKFAWLVYWQYLDEKTPREEYGFSNSKSVAQKNAATLVNNLNSNAKRKPDIYGLAYLKFEVVEVEEVK